MKIDMTKMALVVCGAVMLAAAPATFAQQAPVTTGATAIAPGKAVTTQTTRASVVIVGIDTANRIVTVKRSNGAIADIVAGPDIRNFDQVRVGDKIVVEYTQALSLELKKVGAGVRTMTEEELSARAKAGEKPGAAVGNVTTVLADVVVVDAKKQIVTLRGPKGNQVDLVVKDPAQLKNIKKGDQVEATYVEALAIVVEPTKK